MIKDKRQLFLIFPLTISILLYAILLLLTGMLIGGFNQETKELESQETFTIEPVEDAELSLSGVEEDILPETGQSDKWVSFKTDDFSFEYPENLPVRDLPSLCQGEFCSLEENQVTKIGDLYVSTFHSLLTLDFDFDLGLDQEAYKKPIKTIIDGREFYYIFTKEGNLSYIVSDYKYVDEKLWVKTDYRVVDQGYYISFSKGAFYNYINEDKLPEYEAIFETFKF
jgi:hypothetical protein